MARLSFVLVLLVGLLAGGLGMFLLHPAAPPGLVDADVRGIVAQIMRDAAPAPAPAPQVADLDPAQLNKVIEDYLLSDPTILQRMNDRLAERQQVAERAAVKSQLDAHYADIYQAADNVVLGNPKGDVTLVEMFDYNCTYCRGALPDMATLMADDPNLRIILRQFPILSAGSVDAARIAVLVGEDPKISYWDFHKRLFSSNGQIDAAKALAAAADVGGNRVELMLDMNSKRTADAIQDTYALAKSLNIGATPTYILGDEIIPGAMGVDVLKQKIANLRACGSTECPAPAG